MGYDVELASASATKSFTDEQEATLSNFVTDNSGGYTYAEIAENFEGGHFSAKSIQGKILSMQLRRYQGVVILKLSLTLYSFWLILIIQTTKIIRKNQCVF